jgi:hypothetical protein
MMVSKMAVFWNAEILTDVSEGLTASIIRLITLITLMMMAVSSSETLVNIYQTTRCNIPEPQISPSLTL